LGVTNPILNFMPPIVLCSPILYIFNPIYVPIKEGPLTFHQTNPAKLN